MKKLGISRPVCKDDTSRATRQDIGPQGLRFQYALYGSTYAGIIIDGEHRGIMRERLSPPSGKCQGNASFLVARAGR